MDNFIFIDYSSWQFYWVVKVCEEDDNLSELYGGISEFGMFMLIITFPYYVSENNDTSSSTFSLRKTNLFENLREKFEQMRQQMLDKSAE